QALVPHVLPLQLFRQQSVLAEQGPPAPWQKVFEVQTLFLQEPPQQGLFGSQARPAATQVPESGSTPPPPWPPPPAPPPSPPALPPPGPPSPVLGGGWQLHEANEKPITAAAAIANH